VLPRESLLFLLGPLGIAAQGAAVHLFRLFVRIDYSVTLSGGSELPLVAILGPVTRLFALRATRGGFLGHVASKRVRNSISAAAVASNTAATLPFPIHPRGFEPLTFGSVGPLLPFGESRFHPMAIGILAE